MQKADESRRLRPIKRSDALSRTVLTGGAFSGRYEIFLKLRPLIYVFITDSDGGKILVAVVHRGDEIVSVARADERLIDSVELDFRNSQQAYSHYLRK